MFGSAYRPPGVWDPGERGGEMGRGGVVCLWLVPHTMLLQVNVNAKQNPCLCQSWQQARKFSGLKRLLTAVSYKPNSRKEGFGRCTRHAHLLQSSNDCGAACRSWQASVSTRAAVKSTHWIWMANLHTPAGGNYLNYHAQCSMRLQACISKTAVYTTKLV